MQHRTLKLSLGVIALGVLFLAIQFIKIPSAQYATTTYPYATSTPPAYSTSTPTIYLAGSSINMAGQVLAVNVASSSITFQANWFYGIAGVGSTDGYAAAMPVASKFCTGKIVTVSIASTTKIVSFAGRPMTLSQVQVGSYFNADISYLGFINIAQTIRFSSTIPATPITPPELNITNPGDLSYNGQVPAGSGFVSILGKVTQTTSSSVSAEVQWFFGGVANSSATAVLPMAAHVCPGTIIAVKIDENTKVYNLQGQRIAISSVPAGAFFNATISYIDGVYQGKVLRLTTTPVPTVSTTTQAAVDPFVSSTTAAYHATNTVKTVTTTSYATTTVYYGATPTSSGTPVVQTVPVTVTSTTTKPTSATCRFFSAFGLCR